MKFIQVGIATIVHPYNCITSARLSHELNPFNRCGTFSVLALVSLNVNKLLKIMLLHSNVTILP